MKLELTVNNRPADASSSRVVGVKDLTKEEAIAWAQEHATATNDVDISCAAMGEIFLTISNGAVAYERWDSFTA